MTTERLPAVSQSRRSRIWREPLSRTGHLLIANSILNAATGVGYWLIAARLNSPSVVGVNSAAISAMMLLAGVAQLNLMSTILRFAPTSGAAARPLIRGAFLLGAMLSGLAAVGFLIGLRHWAPQLTGLLGSGLRGVAFVIATMAWSAFVMQDSALVAVRRPAAVPVENTSFAVLKILLVVVFSLVVPGMGIWLSWTGAMVIAVAGTTTYLFWRALPAFTKTVSSGTAQVASLRELGRFALPDYVGAVAWIACTSLVPLIVLDLTNPRQAAAFSLPWQICLALYAIPIAFGQSLVAHGSAETENLDRYHRHALRQSLGLLAVLVTTVVALAPFGLSFFGSWYSQHGSTPLRLLALSSLPNAVVALEVSRARVARHMKMVVAVLLGLCVLVVGLTVALVPSMGIKGGGMAWLGGQSIVAAALLIHRQLVTMRSGFVRSRGGGVPTSVIASAVAAEGWQCEYSRTTVSDSAVLMVRGHRDEPAVLKVAASKNGVASLRRERRLLEFLHGDERLGDWRKLLPVPLSYGPVGDGAYLVTSRLPGLDGSSAKMGLTSWLTPAAINAIAPLHRLNQTAHVINDRLLHRLVDEPVGTLRRAIGSKAALDGIAAGLRSELRGQWVTLGWTHGDFYPGNVIVSSDGRVTGIIDWGQASQHGLVIHDVAFWLLATPRPGEPHEIGARVAARLSRSEPWLPAETELIWGRSYNDQMSGAVLLILTWLRHVSDNLSKSERYKESPLWLRRNVSPVLRAIEVQRHERKARWH